MWYSTSSSRVVVAMCTREPYTLDKVLNELDNSNFDESGDDFDGYVDDDDFVWGNGSARR